jgi:class 3 adenylate cyclase
LSALFEEVGAIVAAEGGVVIGVAGDAVLAAFNTPLDCRDHPARALAAAAALVKPETAGLRLRVGVATGPVAAGTVGGSAVTLR